MFCILGEKVVDPPGIDLCDLRVAGPFAQDTVPSFTSRSANFFINLGLLRTRYAATPVYFSFAFVPVPLY